MRYDIIRDRRTMTMVSIVHHLLTMGVRSFTASEIAGAMGMSLQGTINYLDTMASSGWLRREGRHYVLTPEGIDAYSSILGEIRAFLEEGFSHLGTGEVYAIPDGNINPGDEVRLHMKGGVVYASNTGKGAAARVHRVLDCGIVEVVDIEGIIHIPEGSLMLVMLSDSGHKPEWLVKDALYGAYDTLAHGFLQRHIGRVDFVFAPAEACADAAMKGENAILVLEWRNLPYAIADISSFSRRVGRDIDYTVEKVMLK